MVENIAGIISKECAKAYPGSKVEVRERRNVLNENLAPVVTELVSNCLEQGAARVRVNVCSGQIFVNDDVVHRQDQLPQILKRVNRGHTIEETRGISTKQGIGGVGIWSCRRILKEKLGGGELAYRATRSGRIIASATWPSKKQRG